MPDRTPMDARTGRARAGLPAGGFGNPGPSIMIRQGKDGRVRDESGNVKSPGGTYRRLAQTRRISS